MLMIYFVPTPILRSLIRGFTSFPASKEKQIYNECQPNTLDKLLAEPLVGQCSIIISDQNKRDAESFITEMCLDPMAIEDIKKNMAKFGHSSTAVIYFTFKTNIQLTQSS